MDARNAIAAVDELASYGGSVGKASALSAQERIFCEAFVVNGGNATQAVLEAGYQGPDPSVQACRLLCRPRVADRIRALCKTFIHASIPAAIKALVDIIGDPTISAATRVKAANSLLERGGMATEKGGVQVNVGLQVNGGEVQRLIGSIEDARSQRMSDIAGGMPDNLEALGRAVDELEKQSLDEGAGGMQSQGPGREPASLPRYSSASAPKMETLRSEDGQ